MSAAFDTRNELAQALAKHPYVHLVNLRQPLRMILGSSICERPVYAFVGWRKHQAGWPWQVSLVVYEDGWDLLEAPATVHFDGEDAAVIASRQLLDGNHPFIVRLLGQRVT
jgi:hypothetical protein